MQITESKQNNWTILALNGRIDQDGAAALKTAITPHLTGGLLALDFTNVEYVTSVGFRVLLTSLKEQTAKGGRLLIGNMSESVRSFFDIAGLSTTFKVVHDIHATIAAQK
jgi:anti-anti-sigma factor